MAVIIIVVAGIFFYGGIKYANAKAASARTQARAGGGQFAGRNAGARGAGGGFTAGTVIAKDATSITISVQGGGSKIILYTPSTQVMKAALGTADDVAVGKTITVTGSANPDGSVSAQSIQLRPAPQTPPAQQ